MWLAQGQVWSFLADRTGPSAGSIKKPSAMQAMLKMKKLDIAELERAAEG
jgi:predicted 3-demethylubiquinone-9 3-methyltransferase (glyoxalase superfamily)